MSLLADAGDDDGLDDDFDKIDGTSVSTPASLKQTPSLGTAHKMVLVLVFHTYRMYF